MLYLILMLVTFNSETSVDTCSSPYTSLAGHKVGSISLTFYGRQCLLAAQFSLFPPIGTNAVFTVFLVYFISIFLYFCISVFQYFCIYVGWLPSCALFPLIGTNVHVDLPLYGAI